MALNWRPDEGLAAFDREWRRAYPNAVIYHIGDLNHDTNPRVSQHAPDDGNTGGPGDDPGEVDAGDYMPGHGVTDADLDSAFENLIESRDPRILILIRRDKIVSSVVRPWEVRPYPGHYHGHLHISVNDRYDNNQADWKWEDEVARTLTYKTIEGKLPELQSGDEDAMFSGWNHVGRAQAMINWLESTLPDLDVDGAYGGKTAQKLAKIMSGADNKSSANGTKLREPEWRTLYGLSL